MVRYQIKKENTTITITTPWQAARVFLLLNAGGSASIASRIGKYPTFIARMFRKGVPMKWLIPLAQITQAPPVLLNWEMGRYFTIRPFEDYVNMCESFTPQQRTIIKELSKQ